MKTLRVSTFIAKAYLQSLIDLLAEVKLTEPREYPNCLFWNECNVYQEPAEDKPYSTLLANPDDVHAVYKCYVSFLCPEDKVEDAVRIIRDVNPQADHVTVEVSEVKLA